MPVMDGIEAVKQINSMKGRKSSTIVAVSASVSDEDQAYMRQVLGELVREVNAQNRQDHERAVEVLEEQGLAWHAADPVAVAQWQDLADAASLELVEAGIVSAPIYEDMVRLLVEYRDSVD